MFCSFGLLHPSGISVIWKRKTRPVPDQGLLLEPVKAKSQPVDHLSVKIDPSNLRSSELALSLIVLITTVLPELATLVTGYRGSLQGRLTWPSFHPGYLGLYLEDFLGLPVSQGIRECPLGDGWSIVIRRADLPLHIPHPFFPSNHRTPPSFPHSVSVALPNQSSLMASQFASDIWIMTVLGNHIRRTVPTLPLSTFCPDDVTYHGIDLSSLWSLRADRGEREVLEIPAALCQLEPATWWPSWKRAGFAVRKCRCCLYFPLLRYLLSDSGVQPVKSFEVGSDVVREQVLSDCSQVRGLVRTWDSQACVASI
ncbi:hypothetical protein PoB_002225800 [Plakobranchus ocellatus]|uniref:Uncharacterized protein n=1 Tax=Plakobranchus ocellatus TaxID=259542 RepID=A0AAV3ZMS2_9GAST|nr:hypothetical protein PoB_002225800 [Plakobranchus ocellatus]